VRAYYHEENHITFLFSLLLPFGGAAQKTTSQLLPAHASALQQFLSKHPDLEFLSESDYDQKTLKDIRKRFGARFMPYYRVGDFNHDGRQDFGQGYTAEGLPVGD
jgi:hypothetical protein